MKEKMELVKDVVDSDLFLDMSRSARLLYYDYVIQSDKNGFLNNPMSIKKYTEACDSDVYTLYANGFVIPDDKGVKVLFGLGEIMTLRSRNNGGC